MICRKREYGAISRVGHGGNVSSVERLSCQSEVGTRKWFSGQQRIEENGAHAKRVDAFPSDGISIL